MNGIGVYQIRCLANGKSYVGSTAKGFRVRWNSHRWHLRRGKHDSPHMQNCWNKYGPEAFEFRPLVVCAEDMVLFYEQLLIDALKPEFNTCPTAGSALGAKRTDEHRQKFSKAQRGWRKKYDWKGRKLCLSDIAEMEGYDKTRLISRVLGLGMTIEEALTTPYRPPKKMHEHDGRVMSQTEWAKELGINPRRLGYWLAEGLSIAECVSRLHREAKRMSFSQFCKLSGANVQTASSRRKSGMSLMEAITAPTRGAGARRLEEVLA